MRTRRLLVALAVLLAVAASAALARTVGVATIAPVPQPTGCVSSYAVNCVRSNALWGARAVEVSPDGRHVYVASFADVIRENTNTVAAFSRDPGTGTLRPLPGRSACVSEVMRSDCADGRGLAGVIDVAIAPDGRTVYVASERADAVVILSRDARTGTVTQLAGRPGCVSDNGLGGDCVDAKALNGARPSRSRPTGGTSTSRPGTTTLSPSSAATARRQRWSSFAGSGGASARPAAAGHARTGRRSAA